VLEKIAAHSALYERHKGVDHGKSHRILYGLIPYRNIMVDDPETYGVVDAQELPLLISRVQNWMKRGWVPQGGIHTEPTDERDRGEDWYPMFYQAMVKPRQE